MTSLRTFVRSTYLLSIKIEVPPGKEWSTLHKTLQIEHFFQAKLASAGISDEASEETSEGEITSDNNKSQKSEAEESDNNKSQKSEAEEEEKAEKTEEEKEDIETDDHEQAKREMDKDNSQSPKDPDDSNGAPGVGKHIA